MKTLLIAALLIVQSGKPMATIVIPDQATHWETVAADWLQEYVERSTGAKLPIVAESKAPGGTLISVGHTVLAKKADVNTDGLKYDGCRLVVRDKVLFLIGRDITGLRRKSTGYDAGARGTCRAVTKFLEDVVGVRWLAPASKAVRVPVKKDIAVRPDMDVSFSPAFGYGHGRYLYGGGPASIANNFRTAVLMKSYGGHSYYPWVPEKTYGQTNPEYFRMDANGKRISLGNHLCTTHAGVRALFKKGLFEQFDKGHEWVALGQTDGYKRCQCPACERLDAFRGHAGFTEAEGVEVDEDWNSWWEYLKQNPCERLHLSHKWLIDEAAKTHPDKKVHLLVYSTTLTPSKIIDYYGDNVILEICGDGDPEVVKAWKGKAAGATVYVCWFDITSRPGMDSGFTPAQISKRIRFLYDNGVIGVYLGGGGANWGFHGPSYYVLGKMLGDPRMDYRKLLREYCDGMYGDAADAMHEFFDLLYSRIAMTRPKGASYKDMLLMRYTPAFTGNLDRVLDEAERKADSERARNLIRMTRDQFEFNKLITNAIASHRHWQRNPSDASRQQLRAAVDTFDRFRERFVRYDDAFVDDYFPGHGHFANYLSSHGSTTVYRSRWSERRDKVLAKPLKGKVIGYKSSNIIDAPLTLKFGESGAIETLVVRRTPTAPKLDGKLDEAAWQKADAHVLPPMQANQPAAASTVRALYDARYLYVGFESEEPLIEKLVASTTKRDGPVYQMDCGEIMLAPYGTRQHYYHFIIAPAKDAIYDDRTGFRTESNQDASWDGVCEYGYFVDKARKRWFLEVRIPFTTLNTETPKPGTSWFGNFGRERKTDLVRGNPTTGLFLWSQADAMNFVSPAAFGKIRFGE